MVPGLDHGPHDAAGLGADVGAAVAADLGLVADPAQGDPHERATQGAGHRLAERGLAHTRRARPAPGSTRAVARPARRVVLLVGGRGALEAQLAHGQLLDDAVLDLVQAGVVGVEHGPGVGQVEVVGRSARPRAAR